MANYNVWNSNDAICIEADEVHWDKDMVYMYKDQQLVFLAPKFETVVRRVADGDNSE